MPDVASFPANVTVSAWLNQPLASALRDGEAPVTTGAVASYLSGKLLVALWLAALSRQEPVTEAPALSGPE